MPPPRNVHCCPTPSLCVDVAPRFTWTRVNKRNCVVLSQHCWHNKTPQLKE
ncbi:unnamed protein product [Chondrus crispus]|uniref:Uncharacterized protein n=1 Tax=Chondrus crispus TaxID=2769 RepID=R7QJ52_CHOCR|nr:unnamed protein product [Chondrus crispus]CDF38532.1 unnamed protein product [Chondrus crispus]|eukprot:XP_005718425.1 unnamed protein product [Chondrus crispus]